MTNHKRIAAIFDVDGTLIVGTTMERQFIKFLWQAGELNWRDGLRWLAEPAEHLVHGRSPFKANKTWLRGKDTTRLSRLAHDCFEKEIAPRLLPEAVARLRWHQQAGHFVVLLSGTLDVLLEPLAEYLGVCARIGTTLETADKHLTGRIAGLHPYGETKAECLRAMNGTGAFDLRRSFAYADAYADRCLLTSVGNPVATNADARLRRLAERRGWMREQFTHAKTSHRMENIYGRV